MTGREIVLRYTGEIVSLDDPAQIVDAIQTIRDLEAESGTVKRELTDALAGLAAVQGSKPFTLPDGRKAEIRGGDETVYDPETVETGFRSAGMPEERIRDIIEETVTYRVRVREARQAAAANPAYAAVLAAASRVQEKPTTISIKGAPR